MSPIFCLVASAFAEPIAWDGWVAAYGGAVPTTPAPAFALRGGGSLTWALEGGGLVLGGSTVEDLPRAWLGDFHHVGLEVFGLGEVVPSVSLDLRSGDLLFGDPWAELVLAPGFGERSVWGLEVGPALRGPNWTPGLLTQGWVGRPLGGSFWVGGNGSVRVYARPLPTFAASGQLLGSWYGPVILDLGLGAGWTTETADQLPIAGFYAPGVLLGQGRLDLTWPVGPHLAVNGEGLAELGPGGVAARVLVGVGGSFGGAKVAEVAAPGPVLFSVAPPEAQSVAIAGDFSNWVPVPLAPQPDGSWVIEIRLSPGPHEFVYIVNGKTWLPMGIPTVPDGFGGTNGILFVSD